MDIISSKVERLKAIEIGNGIEYLLNEAYKIFGNPILIHDMEYKIIDMTQNIITDDPIWNEYATKRAADSYWISFFQNECFLEAAANTKKITFLTSDKLKYERIFGKIFNGNNIQIGCAVMIASDASFEDDDPMLFEQFCDIITLELGRVDFYNDYGQAYFEKLIDELIAGVDDVALYAAHVESIYMHLKTNLYLAAVDVGKSKYGKLAYYRDLFRKMQPEYTYAVYDNYILIIVSTDDRALYIEKNLNQLNRMFRKNNIYAGISSSFENLFELKTYFSQALEVLNNGLKTLDQRIFIYEQHKDKNDED